MRIIILVSLLLSTASIVSAQNDNSKTASEKFRQEKENEYKKLQQGYENFRTRRDLEFEKFKAEYEAAFEKFKKNYGKFLDEEEEVINIMSSNDNIQIKPLSLEYEPKIESSAAEEIQKINIDRQNLSKISSSDFLDNLTDSKDETEQLKEGIGKLNQINKAFEVIPESKEEKNISIPTTETVTPIKEIVTPTKEVVIQAKETVIPTKVEKENITPSGKPTNYTRISSAFGYRTHPINWRRQFHKGVDLKAARMTPITATADGTVTYAKRMGGYGNFIKINHQNGYKTAYAHLHRISTKLNNKVKKGDLIGYVGSTGRSTGDHLHYEMYYQDKLIDPVKTF